MLSPEKLLSDVLRFHPDTIEGQWHAAEYVQELTERYALGAAEILEYPEFPDGTGPKYPLVKIIAEAGPGNSAKARSLMTWLGHIDTVQPSREQRNQGDTLVIETQDKETQTSWTKGRGRGTLDMWGGNISYLCALSVLRETGNARHAVQLILSSREEEGSGVLYQAIQQERIERASIGATTEILVTDDGKSAPVYLGRTGRIGINAVFHGDAVHSGILDDNPELIDSIAHRYYARAIDHALDSDRGFRIENSYPGDTNGLLPKTAFARLSRLSGEPSGLSSVGEIHQGIDIFHSDPNLVPERVLAELQHYLLNQGKTPANRLELTVGDRHGVPFINPWLTPNDHPLAIAALQYAKDTSGNDVCFAGARGVAEEGMLFHELGTHFVGHAPIGKGAHEKDEWVNIESIAKRAMWLTKLAQHDGDLG